MKLTHPQSDLEVDVTDDQTEPYVSQGWVQKSTKKADDK